MSRCLLLTPEVKRACSGPQVATSIGGPTLHFLKPDWVSSGLGNFKGSVRFKDFHGSKVSDCIFSDSVHRVGTLTLKLEAAFFCDTLVSTYKSKQSYDPGCLIQGPTQHLHRPFNVVNDWKTYLMYLAEYCWSCISLAVFSFSQRSNYFRSSEMWRRVTWSSISDVLKKNRWFICWTFLPWNMRQDVLNRREPVMEQRGVISQ